MIHIIVFLRVIVTVFVISCVIPVLPLLYLLPRGVCAQLITSREKQSNTPNQGKTTHREEGE